MPNLTGIQLLKGLAKKPMVIFTTAYSEHAAESYNLDAVDYLLKPFTFERFLKSVNKAYSRFSEKQDSSRPDTQEADKNINAEYIFIKSDYKTIKVETKDILYIEGLKDYVKIYAGAKPILSLLSLKSLEEKLPQKTFIRVHRSYIVSLYKIESIQKNRIVIGDKYIPIGDNYKENFYKIIEDYNI
jgi:DNA-binding LytR/AlgR family response regulator